MEPDPTPGPSRFRDIWCEGTIDSSWVTWRASLRPKVNHDGVALFARFLHASLTLSPACLRLPFIWSDLPLARSLTLPVTLPTASLTLPFAVGCCSLPCRLSPWACPRAEEAQAHVVRMIRCHFELSVAMRNGLFGIRHQAVADLSHLTCRI
jgi:hypothetical protein